MKDLAVICFQHANPPTKTHHYFFKLMIQTANQHEGDALVFLSQSYDSAKNPIPWKLKQKYISDILPCYVCDDADINSLNDVLYFIHERQYKKVVIFAGGDKRKEIQEVIDQIVDKEDINFESVKVISSGARDPDSEDTDSIYSSAKARNTILDGNFEAFKTIAMGDSEENLFCLFSMVKAGMGLTEHVIKRNK